MFAVLSTTSMPDHLRGYVSRFLGEVHTGLYVGVVTRRVVEGLWSEVADKIGDARVVLIVSTSDREAGYEIRLIGYPGRVVADFDGVQLVAKLADWAQ